MRFSTYLLLTTALLTPAAASAAEDDPIIVTANRTETPVSRIGQSVSVITHDDIERLQTLSVSELLRTVPGVTTVRNGGIGTQSSVFIRGASSEHTVTLIDGVKINDPSSTAGGFNFGHLLTSNVERIEVVRGPQSVLWGSQAIGGVVNIITKQAGDTPNANLSAEYGYRDTVNLIANGAGRFGPVAVSAGAGYLRTDGISTLSEDRGGVEKDGAEQYGANANVAITVTEALSVDLRGWYSHTHTDVDGGFFLGDDASYNRTREAIGYAGANLALLDGHWRNRIAYSITDTKRLDFNPDALPVLQGDGFGRNERIEYQGVFDITQQAVGGWKAVFGAENERSRFRQASDFGFGASLNRGRAELTSFYGQLSGSPFKGLTLTAGLRHDDHSRFGGKTTLAANAALTPNDGDTVLRISYGEGFKAPSLYQLYSVYGNSTLKPETAKSWDAGIVHKALGGALEVGATWFDRKTRNLIDFVSCDSVGDPSPLCDFQFDGFYDNISSARAKGVEAMLNLRPVDALLFSANYTYVKSQDAITGADLPRRPRHSLNASLDYRWPFGLSTGASITHVGSSLDSNFGPERNSAYVLVDVRASIPIKANVELYGRIENLFDERYETTYRYGQPGRAAYAGVRLSY